MTTYKEQAEQAWKSQNRLDEIVTNTKSLPLVEQLRRQDLSGELDFCTRWAEALDTLARVEDVSKHITLTQVPENISNPSFYMAGYNANCDALLKALEGE